MANLNFDATNVAPAKAFEPLPDGWYAMIIDETEVCQSKKNQANSYLKVRFKVQGGTHNGRVIFENLNLWNANQIAVDIAEKSMSAICHSTGVIQVNNSEQLHGIPMAVKLKLSPAQGIYDPSNDIKGYDNVNSRLSDIELTESAAAGGGAPAGGGMAPPPPKASGTPPPMSKPPAASPPPPKAAGTPPPPKTPAPPKSPPPPKKATPPPKKATPPPPPPKAPAKADLKYPDEAAAIADGWTQHPDSATCMYKGEVVKEIAEIVLATETPAESAPPESAPSVVDTDETPSWATEPA